MVTSGIVLTILVLIVLAVVVVRSRQRMPTASSTAAMAAPGSLDAAAPTSLANALDAATAADGTPLSAAIESTRDTVESLRVTDDTGPLLRRALDHIAAPSD